MRCPLRRLVLGLVLVVTGAAGVLGPASGASAHAEVRETSPAPRSVVGSITTIDMIFWSEVVSGTLTVSDLEGEVAGGVGEPDGAWMLRFALDRTVIEPGTYRVDVAYVSADGDDNLRSWTVEVAAGAAEAAPLTPIAGTPIEQEGTSTVTLAATAALFVCTAALVVLVLRRARQRLAALPSEVPTP